MALDAQTYRCDCDQGYRGALCHLQGEPAEGAAVADGTWCQGLRCQHGRCQETEDGPRCVCDQGFNGENCDTGERTQADMNSLTDLRLAENVLSLFP